MEKKTCYACGKESLSKNGTGLTKKLLDKDSRLISGAALDKALKIRSIINRFYRQAKLPAP